MVKTHLSHCTRSTKQYVTVNYNVMVKTEETFSRSSRSTKARCWPVDDWQRLMTWLSRSCRRQPCTTVGYVCQTYEADVDGPSAVDWRRRRVRRTVEPSSCIHYSRARRDWWQVQTLVKTLRGYSPIMSYVRNCSLLKQLVTLQIDHIPLSVANLLLAATVWERKRSSLLAPRN